MHSSVDLLTHSFNDLRSTNRRDTRQEARGAGQTQQFIYYIDFKRCLNMIRYRIHCIQKKLTPKQTETTHPMYSCPSCQRKYGYHAGVVLIRVTVTHSHPELERASTSTRQSRLWCHRFTTLDAHRVLDFDTGEMRCDVCKIELGTSRSRRAHYALFVDRWIVPDDHDDVHWPSSMQ